jgi:hypothetical protein
MPLHVPASFSFPPSCPPIGSKCFGSVVSHERYPSWSRQDQGQCSCSIKRAASEESLYQTDNEIRLRQDSRTGGISTSFVHDLLSSKLSVARSGQAHGGAAHTRQPLGTHQPSPTVQSASCVESHPHIAYHPATTALMGTMRRP